MSWPSCCWLQIPDAVNGAIRAVAAHVETMLVAVVFVTFLLLAITLGAVGTVAIRIIGDVLGAIHRIGATVVTGDAIRPSQASRAASCPPSRPDS